MNVEREENVNDFLFWDAQWGWRELLSSDSWLRMYLPFDDEPVRSTGIAPTTSQPHPAELALAIITRRGHATKARQSAVFRERAPMPYDLLLGGVR